MLFGIILGMERKQHMQGVGIRTLLLISVSSALLGILSEQSALSTVGLQGDPTRIAAGVITGIGFLGGGVIIHQGLNIRGLTSAAIIWSTAAMGLALGDGQYFAAGITFAIILIALPLFGKFETKFFPAEKNKVVHLSFKGPSADLNLIQEILNNNKLVVRDFSIEKSVKNDRSDIAVSVKAPNQTDVIKLETSFEKIPGLIKFSFGD